MCFGYHSFPLTAFDQMDGMFASLQLAQPSVLRSFRMQNHQDMTALWHERVFFWHFLVSCIVIHLYTFCLFLPSSSTINNARVFLSRRSSYFSFLFFYLLFKFIFCYKIFSIIIKLIFVFMHPTRKYIFTSLNLLSELFLSIVIKVFVKI